MDDRDNLAQATWLAVVDAYQACARRYEELLADLELSAAQYDTLSAIERLGPDAQPKLIAQQLLVTRGNVTGLLDRLSRRGLVRIQPHPDDGRARIVKLTPPGRTLVERTRPRTRDFIEAQMKPFDLHDLRRTRDLMRHMKKHLEQLDIDALVHDTDRPLGDAPRQTRLI